MVVRLSSLVPVLGVPLLGLGVMLALGLEDPAPALVAAEGDSHAIFLISPDPKMAPSFTIFLKQEARNVALCRRQRRPEDVAQAVAAYNLIAQECSPAVFRATGLPRALDR